ncbi:DUF1365 domain-containing protein [Halomonas salinarum]|uniref:DUF1365 domain-containing protein n=1 Tax=Halomonas salinarum TaxID=1158993 RepID=UPI00143B951E|nr:DUF1365 domain-containing protein [Halomonas salinarum]
MSTTPRSRIYHGTLRHQRYRPRTHAFRYGLWMAWLDLDELPGLFRGVPGFGEGRLALARFRRADYLAPHERPLKEVVKDELARQLGDAPDGRVCMLTQLRTLGVAFNPITLYYAYDADDRLVALLAEVSNTPWGERVRYACRVDPERHSHQARFDKAMHVSPFNPMDMIYRWRFSTPGEHLMMHMETWKDDALHFDATLTMQARPATRGALVATLARQPLMSLKTLAGIHLEALRLWAKRVPIHDHPDREETPP